MTTDTIEFNPGGASFDQLYDHLREIRREAPIFYSEQHQGWVVSSYADVNAVAKNPTAFTVENALQGSQNGQYCPRAMEILKTGVDWTTTRHVQTDDGPDHPRFRKALMSVITPRRIREMGPVVVGLVDRLIDGFAQRGKCEFVSEFAYPLAMLTTLRLIGFAEAEENMGQFPPWIDDTFRLLLTQLDEEDQIRAASNAVAFQHYIRDSIAERRANPRDDLLSDVLTQLSTGNASLSDDELVIMFTHSFVGAGHETTKLALTNSIYHLLKDRARWENLVANPDKVTAFVEECLRYDAPLLAWYRYCAQDTEVGGEMIRKGDKVIMLFGSANHDEAKFEDADEFDPFRDRSNPHLTFNTGKHFCVGAPIARLELNTALAQLSQRLPSLRLRPGQDVVYSANFGNRVIPELHLAWDVD